jgi:ADP-heptose:LPS heptosyltransferase
MKIPESVFVTLGGGLGDVFCNYIRGENRWGFVESLKQQHPQVKIRALCSTHNPQTLEFILHNPHITEAIDPGWSLHGHDAWNKYVDGSIRLSECRDIKKRLVFKKPKLYLNRRDQEQITAITQQGSFVLMHPFAGEQHRIAMPAEEYVPLIDELIDKKGLNVVLLGANYTRSNLKQKEQKLEQLDYHRDGLFNLIDKTNARVIAGLARIQTRFIGTWSAYSCLSWLFGKETHVIIKKNLTKKLQKKMQKGQRWHGANCRIAIVQDNNNFDFIREKILRTFPTV